MSWGKEHIQPFRFQGMDIGPFEMTVTIREGETPIEAFRRAREQLDAMAEEEYALKLPRFRERVRESGEV